MSFRFGAAFFLAFAYLGYFASMNAWNGNIYVYVGETRAPAATRSIKDYSMLSRKALSERFHKQLVADAALFRDQGYLGVQLGHPIIPKAEGGWDFACNTPARQGLFNRIRLTFMGTGVAESGQPPKMTVEGSCRSGGSLDQLATFWVPISEILRSQAREQDVYSEDLIIRLRDIPDEWPESWALKEIKLFKQNDEEDYIEVGASLLMEARAKMLVFEWKNKSL